MFQSLKVRFALIAALILLSAWALWDRGINFGLDLQGGTYLSVEVDASGENLTPEQQDDAIEKALTVIRSRIDELGVAEPSVQKAGNDRIIVELAGLRNQERAKEVIQRAAVLEFQLVRSLEQLQPVLSRLDRAVVDAGAAAPADAAPTRPTTVGGLFETAGDSASVQDSAVVRPLSSKLVPGGQEGQLLVASADVPAVQRYLALPEVQRALPRGSELLWGVAPDDEEAEAAAAGYRPLYFVDAEPLITGEHLTEARAQPAPQFGRPVVTFEMNRRGGRIFARGTGANIGRQMAIVLDQRVFSAPVIQAEIGTNGQIDLGGASLEEARDLALVLRAGALPVPIRIAEERTVGPSLGQDSVQSGIVAGLVGLALTVLFISVYYRLAGIMAVIGLAIYLLLILGGLAGLGATLTLPGIAGLILSVGMAVDANVLIFERVREELDAGRPARLAVQEGFRNSLSAIVDSNITTLITALILFQVGTGPVRGFAVTLGIGIIASMFTAIFVVRTLFMLYLDRRSTTRALSI